MTDILMQLDVSCDWGNLPGHVVTAMRNAHDEIERLRNALASAQSAGDTDVTPGASGSEQALQAALRVHAPKRGARLYRNNNGACLDENGRMIRYGLGNDSKKLNDVWKSSDLIGICADGKFLAVEVKKPGWKLTPGDKRGQAQLKFIETIRAMGGRAGFAQSIEDFERIVGQ